MDDTLCQDFFNRPACSAQRQYEALRAVFRDGLSQKEAALRFGYTYDAFRQLVHQFRQDCVAGTPPPFSLPTNADDLPGDPRPHSDNPTPPTAPMSASGAWPPANAGAHAKPASSSSCPCWLLSASTTSPAPLATPPRTASRPTPLC